MYESKGDGTSILMAMTPNAVWDKDSSQWTLKNFKG